MLNVDEILETVGEELSGVASGDAVVGSPVKLGSVTVYPISLVSLGLGGGGGQGENEKVGGKEGARESGAGGGGGGGAKARPVAVLVFSPEGVSVLTLPQRKGPVERLLDKIPELVERFKERGGTRA